MELEKKVVTDSLTGEKVEIVRFSPNGGWYHIEGFSKRMIDEFRNLPRAPLPNYLNPDKRRIL